MRVLSGVFLLLLLSACAGEPAPPAEMTSAERGQIQAEVLDWSDQWLAAASSLDAQGAAAMFDQSEAHFTDGAVYEPTWQAMLDHSQELYGSWDEWQGEWGMRRVDVLAPDLALFVGEASSMIRRADGGEFDVQTTFSFLLRKQDGVWKGLYGQVGGTWTPRS